MLPVTMYIVTGSIWFADLDCDTIEVFGTEAPNHYSESQWNCVMAVLSMLTFLVTGTYNITSWRQIMMLSINVNTFGVGVTGDTSF